METIYADDFLNPSFGSGLKKICQEEANSSEFAYCVGFIKGATQGMMYESILSKISPSRDNDTLILSETLVKSIKYLIPFCHPESLKVDKIRLIFLKYLQDHPAYVHLSSVILIRNAMIKAYPCPRRNL